MMMQYARPITIRVTRSACHSRDGAIFNGVEIDPLTFKKINKLEHFIVLIEDSDQDVIVSTITKGMLLDVTPKAKLTITTDSVLKRFLVTTKKIDFLSPQGALIADLIGTGSRFKGIGPVKAQKLWAVFGERLSDLLTQGDIEALTQVLSYETAVRAIDAWQIYLNLDAMRYCNITLGLDVSVSLRVIEFYQNETIEKLNKDPYLLLAFGLSFIVCDGIAKKLGFTEDSQVRVSAAIEAALYDILNSGSTVATYESIVEALGRYLASGNIEAIEKESLLSKVLEIDCDNYVLLKEGAFQSNGAFLMESFIAETLAKLIQTPSQSLIAKTSISDILLKYEREKGFSLTTCQINALDKAHKNRFCIINGGAGVGKTTLLDVLYRVFDSMDIAPIQLAISGKAAKRMSEATGHKSFTIARFLRKFDFNQNTEFAVVIDESSMVDLPNMYRLLKFIPSKTRIVMLGDTGQLPPIDFGLVFHELIQLKLIAKATLTEVKRQGENSNIPSVANSVRQGIMPELEHFDVKYTEVNGFGKIKALAAEFYWESPNITQIICPTNKMADSINELCSSVNNRPEIHIVTEEFDHFLRTGFRLGDKVMCCKNFYNLDLMNGSLGEVIKVYKRHALRSLEDNTPLSFGRILWDDGSEREVTIELINELKLAYAMTIHKSQGSQFDRVIIPLDRTLNLDRTMLYTAITRAKKEVIFIGKLSVFSVNVR
ncbi:AAA family ATPase [Pseudoalteromonas distincta]|uniref:AAA family ATPase n=1 Tax=Pseudoalteromonas distincta TaxID=77608 RepID=UPI0011959C80|nr:AAA family ATPase [Pseudoalteromonas elyakovii]TVU71511.1 AAA family ATPase [Pseudoalteromonas elyakovii]